MAKRRTETDPGPGADPVFDGDFDASEATNAAGPEPATPEAPPPPPAVSKWDTQLQRAALDLMPGWVGAFKDAMAKVNTRVPTDDEIAASIIAGAESFREKGCRLAVPASLTGAGQKSKIRWSGSVPLL